MDERVALFFEELFESRRLCGRGLRMNCKPVILAILRELPIIDRLGLEVDTPRRRTLRCSIDPNRGFDPAGLQNPKKSKGGVRGPSRRSGA